MHKPYAPLWLLAAVLPLSPTLAEDAQTADKQTEEKIQVTAQKRLQFRDDVGLSVLVLDGEELEQKNIRDTTALSGQAINFKITQNAAEGTPPAVNIRGVGSLDYNTSTSSPVGIYMDGAAGGSANFLLASLFDVDSVELLRGPQGTLFGRNTTAGAILINSRRPGQGGGYFNVGKGERLQARFDGAVDIPLWSDAAARLAVNHRDYDYSTNNLYAPAPEAGLRQDDARFSFLADTDNWEVFAKLNLSQWDGVVNPPGSIGVIKPADPDNGIPAGLCTPAEAGSTSCTDYFGFNSGSNDFWDVAVNTDVHGNSPHQTDSWGSDINLTYRIDEDRSLHAISSYNELERTHYYNCDASPNRVCEGNQGVDSELFSQELRYHQQYGSAYFIGGLHYLNETLVQDNFTDLFRMFRAVPGYFSSAVKFSYDNQIETTSMAAFGHLDYELTRRTTLSSGLRYTRESVDYRAIGAVNIATFLDDQTGFDVPLWNIEGDLDHDNWSGKLAWNHRWTDSLKTYLSYARGFKSGGYNGALITTAEEAMRNTYGPETLNAYELGGRWYWDDKNAVLQFSLFHYDYQDQQVFMNQASTTPGAPNIQLLDNVGSSVIQGLELELSWHLSTEFRARLGAGYLPKAELDEFTATGGVSVSDNRLPFTSKWNLNGALDYVQPLGVGELSAQVGYDYQSAFYFDQNENPYAEQDSYTLWDARFAYALGGWTFALWGKNLTNEEYSHLKFDLINFFGMLEDFKGEGRQAGVDIKFAF